jgi:hypothetical protein
MSGSQTSEETLRGFTYHSEGATTLLAAEALAIEAAQVATVAEAGVVRLVTTGVVVAVVDGNATSGFLDKSIQTLFTSVRADRRARPSSPVRNWACLLDGKKTRPEHIRLKKRNDRLSEKFMFAKFMFAVTVGHANVLCVSTCSLSSYPRVTVSWTSCQLGSFQPYIPN